MNAGPQVGGVLLRYGVTDEPSDEWSMAFVTADVAVRVAELTALTKVDGLVLPGVGIALVDGEVVTVLALGDREIVPRPAAYEPEGEWTLPGSDRAVLCHLGAMRVAIAGSIIVATGMFDAYERSIVWRGQLVPILDVRALYARAEAGIWAGRASPGTPVSFRATSLRPISLRQSVPPPSEKNEGPRSDRQRDTIQASRDTLQVAAPAPPPDDAPSTKRTGGQDESKR